MRSESLRRLQPQEPKAGGDSELTRIEINRQVSQFLARGGEIQQIPCTLGTRPELSFNHAPLTDAVTGTVTSLPSYQLVDGVPLVTVARISNMVGLSTTALRRRWEEGDFPKPVSKKIQLRWDEREVKAWMEKNPDPKGSILKSQESA